MADHSKGPGTRSDKATRPGTGRSPFSSPAAWLVLIALAVFLFRAFQDVGVRRIGYSQWKEMLRAGSFERVVVGPDFVRGYPRGPEADGARPRGRPSRRCRTSRRASPATTSS